MKIMVTYEEADLKRLIRADLARQGIPATDADVEFKKNKATVSVEVSGEDVPPVTESVQTHVVLPPVPSEVTQTREVLLPLPPGLEVVEGGNNMTDFSDVLRASNKVATQKPGMFPVPERELMDGESHDFPGAKR